MHRRVIVASVAALAALAAAVAQNQVTYILVSGERVSGAIASSSEPSAAMPRGELNLERAGGEELSFGQEQVAVIDYDGRPPSQAELASLPADEGDQMVAFRDGNFLHGRLEGLRPDALRWRSSGRIEAHAVGRISRIYLNPNRAKQIFNVGPQPESQPEAPPARGRGDAPARPGWRGVEAGPITVVGTQAWTDTGLNVRRGDRLAFSVTGRVRINPRQTATAAGVGSTGNRALPLRDAPAGALIAKVGDNRAFAIGLSPGPFAVEDTGRLWLGINDAIVSDNAGEFVVYVRR